MDLTDIQHGALLRGRSIDTTANREKQRQKRLRRILIALGLPVTWFLTRELMGNPVRPGFPHFISDNPELSVLVLLLGLMGGLAFLRYMGAGSCPPPVLRPAASKIRLADVVGAEATRR